jgi:hypothetical protein
MVAGHLASLTGREWQEHPEYHPEDGWVYRLTLKKTEVKVGYWHSHSRYTYSHEQVEEVTATLRQWGIKHRFCPYAGAFFFLNKKDVLRAKLAFGEMCGETHVCKPRSQVEAEMRRAARAKKKENPKAMLKPSQLIAVELLKREIEDKAKAKEERNNNSKKKG